MVGHPLAHRKLFTSPASGFGGVALHTGKGVLETRPPIPREVPSKSPVGNRMEWEHGRTFKPRAVGAGRLCGGEDEHSQISLETPATIGYDGSVAEPTNHELSERIADLEERMNTSYERLLAEIAKRDKDNLRWQIGLWVAAVVILGVIIRWPSVPAITN